jgi:MoxR-like ATPase
MKKDWKIFNGKGKPHDGLEDLPEPPPWRFAGRSQPLKLPTGKTLDPKEETRAAPFLPTKEMVVAVNAALYLRRPLLITGKPGTGKSTLIAKVAHELKLGAVLRWPISSRSTVRSGIYEYDAVGRLQAGKNAPPPVEDYLTLGPLATALLAQNWPRALLIDEIDKSDLDFANDLLNVIEEGECEIPELRRLGSREVEIRDYSGEKVTITDGKIVCGQFPFVIMTSNAEREFPAPFLRRCIRLTIKPPDPDRLNEIVKAHLKRDFDKTDLDEIATLIRNFDTSQKESKDVSIDQLLNAIFLTVAMRDANARSFSKEELEALRESLTRALSSSGG